MVTYQYGEDRIAYVELVCSTTDENQFDLLGRSEFTFFLFRLTNKCACWNACSSRSIFDISYCTFDLPL